MTSLIGTILSKLDLKELMIKWSWKFGGKNDTTRKNKNLLKDKKTSGGTHERHSNDKKGI